MAGLREPSSAGQGLLTKLSFLLGAAGLLMAMSADAIAVLGRHVGFTVLGAIEVVQASVVLAASAAMVGATLSGAHARVHILIERLGPAWHKRFDQVSDLVSCLFFLFLAAGSAWVAAELWPGYEITEILGLPLRWLRLVWIGSCILIAVLFLARALGKGGSDEP
ncbi:TRAP transporter small permease [Niveispirillum sp. KHB5.9]|uniref:TRAP transporter small permease n=1 Tax=Niveispirillum sp. KHB5.9 TaxID=3400269 RepID=UPI003A87809E